MFDTLGRKYVQKIFDLMAKPLIKMRLSPIQITLMAALAGVAACCFTILRNFPYRMTAIILGAISAILDVLDGTVARATGRSSPLGALLDLLFDRIVEVLFTIAFAIAFPYTVWPAMVFMGLIIINFSAFLLAGTLFPNDGEKSMHYETGILERTETFVLFGLMLGFPGLASWMLWIFNVLMVTTAIIRTRRIILFAVENGLDGRIQDKLEVKKT